MQIQSWSIDRLVHYARNPRKNDTVVDRMCSSLREFGFKIPVLARSNGEVVDGHLRLKAARKLGINEIPVILCDEWTEAQVKAFRLLVNRSVTWADWDEELLSLELQELNAADFDLSLTGFNPGEIDGLLAIPNEERANETPPVPAIPAFRFGDLWLCGKHRVLCGDADALPRHGGNVSCMANKVIPFPRKAQRRKQRGFALRAGELELTVNINGDVRLLTTRAALSSNTRPKVLPIRPLGAKDQSQDLGN
jgi:ParB/Sulfiredoxin domain